MAFTGTAVVTQVADNLVRITGLSLGSGAAGTIGLNGATGTAPGVRLPGEFKTEPYAYLGDNVPLQDAVQCYQQPAATGVAVAIPVSVVKTGTTREDFRITLTNTHASTASPDLEIYVKYH